MKRLLIFTIVLISFSKIGYAQNNISSEINIYNIHGTWELISKWDDTNIVFVKTNHDKKPYATLIKFENNGKLIPIYSVGRSKCGNDLMTRPKNGDWSFNKENLTLKTSFSIAYGGNEFKILELNYNKLVMTKLPSE